MPGACKMHLSLKCHQFGIDSRLYFGMIEVSSVYTAEAKDACIETNGVKFVLLPDTDGG